MASKGTKHRELAGRVALITGGSRGLGRTIAEAMAKEGASIAICGRNAKDLNSALRALIKKGVVCHAYIADATNVQQIARMMAHIKRDFRRLDILVNNIGGVRQFSGFEGLTDADWQEVFDVNVMSMVHCTRAALPLLRASRRGRIINIASVAGKRPGNFNPHYGAMKAAMIYLSKHLSNQWGKYKILVNAISPHTLKGGAWKRDVAHKARTMNISLKQAERMMMEEVTNISPLHDIGLPQDVADLAVFLASDRARFITGTCITVDGGVVNSIF